MAEGNTSWNVLDNARKGNEAAYLPKKSAKVNYRIDDQDGTSILIMAGFFDLLSVIPGVNDIVVLVAQFLFFVIFTFFHGVSVVGKKTWIWYLVAWVVELIPFLSIFPTLTLMAFRMIAISRVEDRVKSMGLQVEGEKTKAIARRFMQQKNVQDRIQQQEKQATRNKDGSANTEKQGRINDRRSDLDNSLKKRDPNSGVKAGAEEPDSNYLAGGNASSGAKTANAVGTFFGNRRNEERGRGSPVGQNTASNPSVTTDNGSDRQTERSRTERKLTPEEAENADLSRRSQREEITDYGNKSPRERGEEVEG
jgi:hypothetical protein